MEVTRLATGAPDCYAVLNLEPGASRHAILKAYYMLRQELLDSGYEQGSVELFRIVDVKDSLLDDTERENYDAEYDMALSCPDFMNDFSEDFGGDNDSFIDDASSDESADESSVCDSVLDDEDSYERIENEGRDVSKSDDEDFDEEAVDLMAYTCGYLAISGCGVETTIEQLGRDYRDE